MSRQPTPASLTVEATWLLDEARALAASSRSPTFDTVHLLAAALHSDTTFGAALRRTAVAERSDEIDAAVRGPEDQRTPVHRVQPTSDILALTRAAEARARRDGRAAIDAEDLVWTLTSMLGPHSRFFASGEPKVRSTLAGPPSRRTTAGRRRSRPIEAASCMGSLAWTLWSTLMKALSAGVTVLVAGAGIVLHHAAVSVLGLLLGFRASFAGWWSEQIGGRLETNRALSTRETVAATLAVRTLMAAVAVGTFGVVLLELRGVGLSPSPRLTQDPTTALGPRDKVDVNLLLILYFGRRPMELWIALGAAFMAIPTFSEVDRVRELLASGSRRARIAARALGPVRSVTWIFDRFDAVTTQLGLPTMISSGVVGVIGSAFAGSLLADLMIAVAA